MGMAKELLVEGIGASAGTATGRAVLILKPDDFDRMLDDAVLICPMTTPEWVPVMVRAAAIVTDIGGKMSHAAIVCRELGTPAVVGTLTGTQDVVHGAVVTVDGSEGKVYEQ
jgi:pyruvate,water dikinase